MLNVLDNKSIVISRKDEFFNDKTYGEAKENSLDIDEILWVIIVDVVFEGKYFEEDIFNIFEIKSKVISRKLFLKEKRKGEEEEKFPQIKVWLNSNE